MEKALLIKEWLKTRRVFSVLLLLAIVVAVYAVLMMKRLIELKGVDHLWLIMLPHWCLRPTRLPIPPSGLGIAIGVAQMVPEMTQKRLKLTLHLPYPQGRLVMFMLLFGLAELLAVFLMQALIIAVYDFTILPVELVGRVMLTTVPWYFAGFTAYLFVTAICLEGTWARRIVIGMLGVAVLMIYFLQPALEAYNGMILLMMIFVAVLTVLSFGSVIRFKEGRQD